VYFVTEVLLIISFHIFLLSQNASHLYAIHAGWTNYSGKLFSDMVVLYSPIFFLIVQFPLVMYASLLVAYKLHVSVTFQNQSFKQDLVKSAIVGLVYGFVLIVTRSLQSFCLGRTSGEVLLGRLLEIALLIDLILQLKTLCPKCSL
jgi:hypothetical protein